MGMGLSGAQRVKAKESSIHVEVSMNVDTPHGWFILENPSKMGWFGGTPTSGSLHIIHGPPQWFSDVDLDGFVLVPWGYRNSPVMHPSVSAQCKPLLFQDGPYGTIAR